MAKFGIAAVVIFGGAYGLGQTGLPGKALVASMDWLTTHGYVAMGGSMGEIVMSAL